MSADQRLEALFTKHALSWELMDVRLLHIDEKRSLNNQARLVAPIDISVVETYAISMIDGAVFPPIVVHRPDNGNLVILDGNHRFKAAKQLEFDSLDAYILGDLSPELADYLARMLNTTESILPLTREDRITHAYHLHQKQGLTVEVLSRQIGVTAGVLGERFRFLDRAHKLERIGISTTSLARTTVDSIGRLSDHSVIHRTVQLVRDAKLPSQETMDLVNELLVAPSTEQTDRIFTEWQSRPSIQERLAKKPSSVKRKSPMFSAPYLRLFRILEECARWLEKYPSMTALKIMTENERQALAKHTARVSRAFDLLIQSE
jgi:hypothetical protein